MAAVVETIGLTKRWGIWWPLITSTCRSRRVSAAVFGQVHVRSPYPPMNVGSNCCHEASSSVG